MLTVKVSCEFLKSSLIAISCFVLMSALQLSAPCKGQDIASASPAFMAATIKPSDPNRAGADGEMGFTPEGSFDAKAQSLKELIEFAYSWGSYDVDQRIVGGPKWMGTAKFDIRAKCDEETARAFGTLPVKRQMSEEASMVQALLTERFKLRAHHETRMMPVFALVSLKGGGSRMKPSANADPEEPNEAEGPVGDWKAEGVAMNEFASQLSTLPELGGRMVVDKTDLKGKFDFALKWTPDTTMGAAPPSPESGLRRDASVPSLLTALEEQVGLRLKSSREPVNVIVIGSVELPTAN